MSEHISNFTLLFNCKALFICITVDSFGKDVNLPIELANLICILSTVFTVSSVMFYFACHAPLFTMLSEQVSWDLTNPVTFSCTAASMVLFFS